MKWFDSLAANVAPEWAVKRVAAKATIERLYDAAKTHHQHKTPTSGRRSADGVMSQATDKITVWARHLDENHDIVTGLLSVLANNVSQMSIEPMVRLRGGTLASVMNDRLADLFRRWRDTADYTGSLGWSDLCHIMARTWFRDGEVFINHIEGEGGDVLPYSIEVLEPEFCPFELTQDSPAIVHGIEKDGRGRPSAYYFYPSHPGNQDTIVLFRPPSLQDVTRVNAANVSHVKFVRRLHQTRGVSVLHSVVHRLDSINDYEQSEQVAARISASLCAFIQTAPNWGVANSVNSITGEQPYEMDAGQIYRLNPGESIEVPGSTRPNTELMNFRRAMLRAVAAGTGTRYSTLSRDYSDGSYSSQRQELVEARPFDTHYRESWTAQLLRPMWKRFVRMAMVTGKIADTGINPDTLYDMEASGVSIPWIDMQKEIAADTQAVESGFKSRQQVIREHGLSLREIDRERDTDSSPATPPMEAVPDESPPDADEGNTTA